MRFREALARIYGIATPLHPGKWRVIHALLPAPRPSLWRTVRLNGFRISVDIGTVMGEHIYYGRSHERWETRQAQERIRPGDTVIDAGANIGYYSLLFARLVGPAGRVYAFEPSAQNCPVLEANLLRNCVGNVKIVRAAVSDRNGTANLGGKTLDTLQVSDKYSGEQVPVVTLDSWAESVGLGRLDFLKADIEGHEIPMLRGGEQTIRRFRPTMLLEVCASNQEDCGWTVGQLRSEIIGLGYRVYRIHRKQLVPWVDDPGLSSFGALALAQD